MKTIRICMGCGLPVGPDAPGGLCAECLLKSGVDSQAGGPDAQESMPTPVPGETFGPYRIVRLLGHGGMGRVYEAEHVASSRRVALKVIGKALSSDADRKRFLREGRLAAAVNHPNVVYIHGSEEVDGVPMIAMELVHGGTLKDRLKRDGALPIAEAVEAAIGIIDGLEAAHAAGVLHRDIKPANCFVAADGAVKVGDFGLSVSTLARGESLLTATGSVLGTPAYASPEQLRGEELDVRSDIYSVGATLYHLLTGNTPFGATDFVKLITEVLDRQPPPPVMLRQEIPAQLSKLVMRCLAKDRKARFQGYAELREALLSFRTAEVVPANPGLRVIAALVDDSIGYLPSLLFLVYWALDPIDMLARDRTFKAAGIWLAFYLFYILYYSVFEGLWGSALGKTLCGLRVVDASGQAPGVPRAFLRAIIYVLPSIIPSFVLMAAVSRQDLLAKLARGETLITDWLWLPMTLALFLTMRRRNGFAAIHDWLSRTRVIVRPKTQPQPALSLPARTSAPVLDLAGTPPEFRPYETRGILWKGDAGELWLAHDPMLRRPIWIHVRTDASATSLTRRDLSRPGRLRWLNAGSLGAQTWDAYEALPGAAFADVCVTPQPWNAVRFWLTHLAEELVAEQNDDTAAAIVSLDHIWITANGQAVLLDFPAPTERERRTEATFSRMDPASAQAFLSEVAAVALHCSNKVDTDDTGRAALPRRHCGNSSAACIPLHARQFLDSLQRRAFDKVEFIAGNLRSLLAKPAELTRQRRFASLALMPALATIIGMCIAGVFVFEQIRSDRIWHALYPDKPSMRLAARIFGGAQDKEGPEAEQMMRTAGIFMANHFRAALTNETLWANPDFGDAEIYRRDLKSAIEKAHAASTEEVARAEQTMAAKIAEKTKEERLLAPFLVIGTELFILLLSTLVVLASILIFGVNPVLHLFGIAVATRNGRRAGRGRLLLRWLVTWSVPAVLAVLAATLAMVILSQVVFHDMQPMRGAVLVALPLLGVVLLAGGIAAVLRPSRGLPDMISGTCLVPK